MILQMILQLPAILALPSILRLLGSDAVFPKIDPTHNRAGILHAVADAFPERAVCQAPDIFDADFSSSQNLSAGLRPDSHQGLSQGLILPLINKLTPRGTEP